MLIGLDIDGVLAEFIEPLLDFYHGLTGQRFHKTDIHSYDLSTIWGGSYQQAVEIVRQFYAHDSFDEVQPIPGAPEAILEIER